MIDRMFDRFVDAALEATIAPSFTRVGSAVRSRLFDWNDLASYDLSGRVIVVTGGTSGLGRQLVVRLATLGADVTLVGRNAERNERVVEEITAELASGTSGSGGRVRQLAADVGELSDVDALAERLLADRTRIDVLVHNAGALSNDRTTTSDGIEATVASQVIGPFRLTCRLLPLLARPTPDDADPGRVLTMSSGGMYAVPLTVGGIELSETDYRGATQYALAKRAQVTLAELWAERCGDRGVRFHSVHPGWADTPGVQDSLPGFARVVGPLLRSADEGADTMAWLCADAAALDSDGGFWHDRRRRSIHRLPTTRRSDTPERRQALWEWVVAASGCDPEAAPGDA